MSHDSAPHKLSLDETFQRAVARIPAAAAASAKASGRRPPASGIQLEIWPERVRGLPNTIARSALFTAAGKKEVRNRYERNHIVALEGTSVLYTGEELRQDDLDVWLQVVHQARTTSVGDWVEFSGHSLLTALGWGRGADRYRSLRSSILRMAEATIWVTNDKLGSGFSCRLVGDVAWANDDGTAGNWRARLDQRAVDLFAPQGVSMVDWERRLALRPLAKWLYGFLSSHREPYPYKVETLFKLSGSKTKRLSGFRTILCDAFEQLKDCGFLVSWEYDRRRDVVQCLRRGWTQVIEA